MKKKMQQRYVPNAGVLCFVQEKVTIYLIRVQTRIVSMNGFTPCPIKKLQSVNA